MANYGHQVRIVREAAKEYRKRWVTEHGNLGRKEISEVLVPVLGRDPTNTEIDVFMWFIRGWDKHYSWSNQPSLRKWCWEQ